MTRLGWIVVGALLALARTGIAEDAPPPAGTTAPEVAPADTAPDWEFEFLPYGWIPGTIGTFDVKGRTARVDVTVGDTIDLLTGGNAFAGAGYFAARHREWSAFVDAFGGYEEMSATSAVQTPRCTIDVATRLKVKPVLVDVGFGYELGRWTLPARQRPLTLGVYAGMRYTWMGQRLKADASVPSISLRRSLDVSEDVGWADPMIGVRWNAPLFDILSLEFRADIGGFGASSDLIWGIASNLQLWLPWQIGPAKPWAALGYRIVAFDHPFDDGLSADLQLRGPTAGVGFLF